MPHNDLPEGVHRVRRKTKNGDKYHFYAWRGGPKFWESQVRSPRDPEFSVAFSTAVKPRLAGEYMTPQMVDDFLDSTAMPQGARTQADYRKWALRFASEFAEDQAKMWEHPKSRGELNEWRAKWKSSPKQHDYAGTVAVRILNWARDEGKIAAHYCDRLHRIYSVDRAEIVWTEADQQAFKDAAPSWVKRVMTLACETGLRPADLVRLTRGNLESFDGIDRFGVRTQKRGRVAHIPVTPELRQLIDETPQISLFCWSTTGTSRSGLPRPVALSPATVIALPTSSVIRATPPRYTRHGGHTAPTSGPRPQPNRKSHGLVASLRRRCDRALCCRFAC